jgi:asparagine synthase (glutamine-hydrolysing)
MSAIFGIIDLAGRPVNPAWIISMQQDLCHRGPDGQGYYSEPFLVLGHMLLKVTPESEFEKSHYIENGLVIVANARLDERNHLMNRLQIPEPEREQLTDPILLLRSYQKWGRNFVKDIYGDFSFAIWNIEKKELFCARDQMGVKPFIYYFNDKRFVFSTELKSIVRLPFTDTEIDNNFLRTRAMAISDEPQKTCWKNILRLLPAHTLNLSIGKLATHKYWQPAYKRNKLFKTEEDSADAVKLLLEKIIADHTRVTGDVGVPLSGGLDSSVITCLAARKLYTQGKKIITASSIYSPGHSHPGDTDEMLFINEVISQEKNIIPTFVHHSDHSFINGLADKFRSTYAPVNGFHYVDEALYNQFRLSSVRRVLSGYLGDQTVTNSSLNPFPILFTSGRLSALKQLIDQYNKNDNQPIRAFLKHIVLTEFTPKIFQKAWNRSKNNAGETHELADLPFILSSKDRKIFQDKIDGTFRPSNFSTKNIAGHIWPTDFCPFDEEMDSDISHHQIEMTYPLADRRLIELLLEIPVEHFFAGGKKRGLIRKAMKGILPEKIRNRNSKGQYSPGYTGLIRNDIDQIIHMIEKGYLNSGLYKLIDVQKLKIQLKNLSESEIEDSFTYFNWTLIEIAMWVYFCKTLETK